MRKHLITSIWIALSVLWLLLSPTASWADERVPEAAQLFTAALPHDKFASESSRNAFVLAAGAYCTKVSKVWPRNSPAEDEWLRAEMAGEGERFLRAIRSVEFGRRIAWVFSVECENFVSEYRKGNESLGLVGLAYTFNRFAPDAAFHAQQNSVSSKALALGGLSFVTGSFLDAAIASMTGRSGS